MHINISKRIRKIALQINTFFIGTTKEMLAIDCNNTNCAIVITYFFLCFSIDAK